MKKQITILMTIFFIGIIPIKGQTYCYRLLHSVNNQGVKSKTAHTYKYVTFIKNMSICYESDEYGNKTHTSFDDAGVCLYKGISNGTHIYEEPYHQILGAFNNMLGETFYFSSDFSRMNYKNRVFDNLIMVYEKVSAPKDERAPVELY